MKLSWLYVLCLSRCALERSGNIALNVAVVVFNSCCLKGKQVFSALATTNLILRKVMKCCRRII